MEFSGQQLRTAPPSPSLFLCVAAIISKATGLDQARQNSSTHTHQHTHTHAGTHTGALQMAAQLCCCCCCCCWHSKLCHTFFNILARNALKFVARRINAATVCVCASVFDCVAKGNERAKRAAKGGKAKPEGSSSRLKREGGRGKLGMGSLSGKAGSLRLADWHTH